MKKYLILQVLFVSLFLSHHASLSYAAKGSFSEYYNQGIEFYKQGKYDQAGENFKKALELKPNDAYALYSLGNTHYCKSSYDEAVKTYSKAIEINPDYAKAHYSLSLAYSKLGMTKKAEEEKKIFRKLSKGGKGARKSKTQTKTPRTKAVQTKEESNVKVYVNKGEDEAKAKALVKQAEKEPEKKVYKEIQRAPATGKRDSSDQSQTVFKGYSSETKQSKSKSRVFTPKRYKKYLSTSGLLTKIKNKWSESGLNKVWICTMGYILTVQMWLCAVAFVGFMVWRVRKKIE